MDDMTKPLNQQPVEIQLRAVSKNLATLDAKRASLMEHRDRLILAAHGEGITWSQIQKVSGLSTRAVALALGRAKQ